MVASTLSVGDPTYDSTAVWAERNGVDMTQAAQGKATKAQKEAYAVFLAEHYYSVVTRAIRAVDTCHLILGSRLHGVPRSIQGVVDMSHKYCDVTSVNFYDYFCPDNQIARTTWTNDHPCLVTEFYIKDIHFASGTQEGAGWYVNNQTDRGRGIRIRACNCCIIRVLSVGSISALWTITIPTKEWFLPSARNTPI